MTHSSIKLQHFLSLAGVASRRQAEKLIVDKKVLVNNQVAALGQRITPSVDAVRFEGRTITIPSTFQYWLINKPVGYVTTLADELNRPVITSLLPANVGRLHPIGRLDLDSQGLVVMTNDGELTHVLTHPKFEIPRKYLAQVEGHPSEKAIEHLERGVRLKEGYTNPSTVRIVQSDDYSTTLEITINQGWNRQVRRMMERVGYPVLDLTRISHGPFKLDDLPRGKARQIFLSKEERTRLVEDQFSD